MSLRVYESGEPDPGEWLRPPEAAAYLGWSERHLRYVRRAAVIAGYGDPAHRVGLRIITFRRGELDDLAEWFERLIADALARKGDVTPLPQAEPRRPLHK